MTVINTITGDISYTAVARALCVITMSPKGLFLDRTEKVGTQEDRMTRLYCGLAARILNEQILLRS